ncbi:MAG: hypothetical protein C0594_06715 [Marinilabiliales bacterium]|nr:MAG: hypothetical protein C0594_06715 [Marinilabiliales bacterium]
MTRLQRFYIKFYYRLLNLFPFTKVINKQKLNGERNVFIYFDYEREFSGFDVGITNKHVEELLDFLDSVNIKTTWFTVGRIVEQYPDTVSAIISRGHELASHTYSHIAPFQISQKKLREDFKNYHNILSTSDSIKGFHSPNGQWTVSLLKMLKENQYSYDVFGSKRESDCFPGYLKIGSKYFRFPTIGDDWPAYIGNYNKKETYNYFINKINCLPEGALVGIGFHPWVLVINNEIYEGFKMLLRDMAVEREYKMQTAYQFYKDLTEG